MKLYSIDTVEDLVLGVKGNQNRDEYEAELEQFYVGEAIRRARILKNLTQEELGARVGVQRSQISRIEKGITLLCLICQNYSKPWMLMLKSKFLKSVRFLFNFGTPFAITLNRLV